LWGGLQLLPHLVALAEHTDPGTETVATDALFCKAAHYLQRDITNAGPLILAIPLLERAHAACARVQGEDHPDTLGTCNLLAVAYQSAGDLARAIPLLERTLADCVRALGDDHPLTQTVRINLRAAAG